MYIAYTRIPHVATVLGAPVDENIFLHHCIDSHTLRLVGVSLPHRALQTTSHSMKALVNQVTLQAALKPIQGAEFDLDEASIEKSTEASTQDCRSALPQQNDSETDDVVFEEIKEHLQHDHVDSMSTPTKVVRKYPNLVFPSGPLKKKSHALVYTTLFKMAWGGEEEKARLLMTRLRRDTQVSVDLKIVSMEVVHTVNTERDLKVLTSALAFTDRGECENRSILKCRLHRRIAGLHYRNQDLDEANEHMETALQLAHNIGPDIDTIYTWRLKALMLFEDYKKTKDSQFYRGANEFFTKAMAHARLQPESKRVVTERVKVSKALFHLDMREEYRQQEKEQETLGELELRAQETLGDVDEDYLTNADKAFYYLTRAKLLVLSENWVEAKSEAEKSLTINQSCGFHERAKVAQNLLEQLSDKS